jgi:hypothetical protein
MGFKFVTLSDKDPFDIDDSKCHTRFSSNDMLPLLSFHFRFTL